MQTKITITANKEGALYEILARMAVNNNSGARSVTPELMIARVKCYAAEWLQAPELTVAEENTVLEIYEGAYCTMRMEWREVQALDLDVENYSVLIVNPG